MGSRLDLGPRFCGAKAWRAAVSRSRRQVDSREEYKPSRRSRAPMPLEPLAWSTAAKMRCLYSAVNRRRLACATTSGSGWSSWAAALLPSVELRLPSLCSGSLRPTEGKNAGEEEADTLLLFTLESFSPCSVIREREVSQLCWHGGVPPMLPPPGRGCAK